MNPDALKQARTAMAAQNFVIAEDIARAAIAQAPDSQGYESLANALRAQERLEEALVAAETAVRLDGANIGALHSRAFILSRLGRFAEALALYDQLIARGVARASVWLNRSVALLGLTRDADAEAALIDGVRRWPQDLGLQNMLASLRWMRGGGDAFGRWRQPWFRPDAMAVGSPEQSPGVEPVPGFVEPAGDGDLGLALFQQLCNLGVRPAMKAQLQSRQHAHQLRQKRNQQSNVDRRR